MKYLLDSNILRYYASRHPILTRNLARISADQLGLPFVVVIEQLRGRFDAYLKAEPENLLREQTRLIATQQFLSLYQTVYATEQTIAELQFLRQKVSTRKRYADVVIAAMVLASEDILVTRNVADFRDLLPPLKIQNWVDQVY